MDFENDRRLDEQAVREEETPKSLLAEHIWKTLIAMNKVMAMQYKGKE